MGRSLVIEAWGLQGSKGTAALPSGSDDGGWGNRLIQAVALTLAMGRVSMKIGDRQTCTSGGLDSAGDDRVSQALS